MEHRDAQFLASRSVGRNRSHLDLTNQAAVEAFFADNLAIELTCCARHSN
jgi:hypothetical protein